VSAAYTLTMTTQAGPPPGFLLTATPTSGQSTDRCGVLTINQAGTRTAAASGCW
jgi:type IV pilus assembly protein PilE